MCRGGAHLGSYKLGACDGEHNVENDATDSRPRHLTLSSADEKLDGCSRNVGFRMFIMAR
jgi:hypothetical protein